MKIPKWIYPKEINKLWYWSHLFVDAVIFISLWLIIGQITPSIFGFSMPALTWNSYFKTLISPLLIIVWFILGIADIISHTVHQKD